VGKNPAFFYGLNQNEENIMARGRGSCGGKRRQDGSGAGKGNKGTKRQPK